MSLKIVWVEGYQFDAGGIPGHLVCVGSGKGSTLKSAVCHAIRDMLKKPALKHKQISSFKMSVAITKSGPENGQEEK